MNGDELKLLYRIDEKVDNLIKRNDKLEEKVNEISENLPQFVTFEKCHDTRKEQKGDKRGTYAMIVAAISTLIAVFSFVIKIFLP